jgi:HSP20 family protein
MSADGLFHGIGGFIKLLSNLTEEGAVNRSGVIEDEKRGARAVYGFSVRLGAAGVPHVEPFGNVKVGAEGPMVDESREPLLDLFDEDDHFLILAEMPGVEAGDIHFEIRGDVLDLSAARGDRKYDKEILLPGAVDAQRSTSSYRNGIFEIKLPKAH